MASFDESEYTGQDISDDDFYSSLRNVYAYLKQNNYHNIERLNYEYCRYKVTNGASSHCGGAGIQMIIPMEVCIDCKVAYFHNPDDCGIDEGEGYCEEWICNHCLDERTESNIMPFDGDRQQLRESKKNEIISAGIIIEEQEKCCICLDELIICEVEDQDGRIDKNKELICNHKLCGKCYFDMKKQNIEEEIHCPLCRTKIDEK
jgi:hypothetical protein